MVRVASIVKKRALHCSLRALAILRCKAASWMLRAQFALDDKEAQNSNPGFRCSPAIFGSYLFACLCFDIALHNNIAEPTTTLIRPISIVAAPTTESSSKR